MKMNFRIIYVPALVGIMLVMGFSSIASAIMDLSDPTIINLYRFDEATSGNLDNNPTDANLLPAFYDTAPTGTAQNHDQFEDAPSDGPEWGGGADFIANGALVGTGGGLIFDRVDNDRTRAGGWMDLNQGGYSEGGSFTIMARVYHQGAVVDNVVYHIYHNGDCHGIRLKGASMGLLTVDATVRSGSKNSGTETFWYVTSGTPDPDIGDWFAIDPNTWTNVFLIYEANTSLTVAADIGDVSFHYSSSTSVPSGFDSLLHGFSDPERGWSIGTNGSTVGTFNGRLESLVVWDYALSLQEADDLSLVTLPETCEEVQQKGFQMAADYNGDCHIGYLDLVVVADNWLMCNDPADPECTPNY